MRKLWPVLAIFALPFVSNAGEKVLLNGCSITSNGAVGSSASDVDCVWKPGDWLKVQCDQSIYYRTDGVDPTSASPKINFPGEAYPVHAIGNSTDLPLKILNSAAAATCNVYLDDRR